jgi:hypothetical protein
LSTDEGFEFGEEKSDNLNYPITVDENSYGPKAILKKQGHG